MAEGAQLYTNLTLTKPYLLIPLLLQLQLSVDRAPHSLRPVSQAGLGVHDQGLLHNGGFTRFGNQGLGFRNRGSGLGVERLGWCLRPPGGVTLEQVPPPTDVAK